MESNAKKKVGLSLAKSMFEFKQEHQQTGLMLVLHHTESADGKAKRIPFNYFHFDDNANCFVAINSRGDVFIFDLLNRKFWRLDGIATSCSCFTFDTDAESSILIGLKSGIVLTVNYEIGEVVNRFQASCDRLIDIKIVKCAEKPAIVLCYSSKEVVIWSRNHDSGVYTHRQLLNTASIKAQIANLSLKKLSFNVTTDESKMTVAALLNDDSVYIYDNINTDSRMWPARFELAKHIYPLERRNVQMSDPNNNSDELANGMLFDLRFAQSGSQLWFASSDSCFSTIETTQWQVKENILMQDFAIKAFWQMPNDFVLEISKEPMHKLLSCLTTLNGIVLMAQQSEAGAVVCEKLEPPKCKDIKRMLLSKDGNLLALGFVDGTINIYSMDFLVKQMFINKHLTQSSPNQNEPSTSQMNPDWSQLNQKLETVLPRQRLMIILSEYGEYPSHYRQIIWHKLLQLPFDSLAATELIKKDIHVCTKDYEQLFPMPDPVLMQNFKKIASRLAHWSRIVSIPFNGHDNFLPYFIFPFVKTNANNLLMCFELIATILLNQCQLWFEFSPMPPINYLGMIENILNYFEPSLVRCYRRHAITNLIFAWEMSRTAFSEILDDVQWQQLWDHLISGPSYFIIFVVVAYNAIHRSVIERMSTSQEICAFFIEPSITDLRKWLEKSYALMSQCPPDLHPNQYMEEFRPLSVNNQYQRILNYPKQTVHKEETFGEQIARQTKAINHKYMELEKFEMNLMQQLTLNAQLDEHKRRMQKVDLVHEEALLRELKRIEDQRKHLILYERQVHNREILMELAMKEKQLENEMNEREHELKKDLYKINRQKIYDETDLLAAEQDLRKREMDMLARECNVTMRKRRTESQQPSDKVLKLRGQLEKQKDQNKRVVGKMANQSIETLEFVTNRLEEVVGELINSNKTLNK